MSVKSPSSENNLDLATNYSEDWKSKSRLNSTQSVSSRSASPSSRVGEEIFENYLEIIKSKSTLVNETKQVDHLDKPYDFYDDEEFAFGINLLNNNVACVGDNITKLIQLAQEPWPDNVKLFQPYEVEQILLPDNASCLAVQAFLKMCNLPFEVEMRWNAEFMSPSGRVPFIKCGAFVVSELEPIAQFAANKGASLCGRLSTEEKAEMRAYMSLITNVLVNAELYISWIDNDTFNQVTKVRNSSVYPWPLGWLQTRAKRGNVAKRLKALHWHDKTLDQVLADVDQCCNSLSQRLGEKDYFFGTPTPLDALVYGHVRALLGSQGPKMGMMLRPLTTALLQLVVRVTRITGIKLTPQEEYLLHEAFVPRRRLSPARSVSERSARARRSRVSVRRQSADNITRDIFGKPFASKRLMIMTSKEGHVTCKYNENGRFGSCTYMDENEYYIIIEIIEDIFDRVEEIIIEGLSNVKHDSDKNEFEVIAFPNQTESRNGSLAKLDEEGMETLEDVTDNSISIDEITECLEDVKLIRASTKGSKDLIALEPKAVYNTKEEIGLTNETGLTIGAGDLQTGLTKETALDELSISDAVLIDNNSVADDKFVYSDIGSPPIIDQEINEHYHTPELTDSSNGRYMREDALSTIESCGSEASNKPLSSKSNSSIRTGPFSSESKSTLKMLSDEEISVESLLKYLRKRNATYHITNMPEVVDVD